MGFAEAVKTVLSKYVTFSGRARRSEFWWGYLGLILIALVGGVLDAVLGAAGVLLVLAYLGILLPLLASGVRRLHDTSRSGWWVLLGIVPFGGIALLVFWVMDSTPEQNEHGPSPKQAAFPGYGSPAPQAY